MSQAKPAADTANITDEHFFIAGIGASAGGLEALEQLFENTAVDSGLAYVVVQHLSPDFKSVMDQLLTRKTKIPVRLIEDGTRILPNHIYLLPPKKEAILSNGKLLLADRSAGEQLSFPIDHFFRSLAQDAGRNSIAIVLSGTGTDGSRGILDIHAAGGLVVVQSEASAKFDGMPRSACDTGIVDMVLPAREMPAALLRYLQTPWHAAPKPGSESNEVLDAPLRSILTQLKDSYDLDFSHYKSTTIGRRIERRLLLTGTVELEEYAERVKSDEGELDRLYRDLLIGVTGFFRDKEVFDRLELDVIPELFSRLGPGEEFRAWVAACATGEEAYSLAILLAERLQLEESDRPVRVFASDVHRRSLKLASRAIYQPESLAGLTAERLERHFIQREDGYHVSPEVRKMVVFTPHNVIRDAPFTRLDMITCRNMLIYFTQPAQKKALSLFHFGLKRNGVLCLGTSETTGDLSDEFEPIDDRARIYRKHRELKLTTEMRMPIATPARVPAPLSDGPGLLRSIPAQSLLHTYDQLLEHFMPPGILISSGRELIHTFKGAGKYFRAPQGRPSSDILEALLPDLRSTLSAAIRRGMQNKAPVKYAGVKCQTADGPEQLTVMVLPIEDPNGNTQLLLQFQSDSPTEDPVQPANVDASTMSNEEFEAIERELQFTKDSLQSTIEELQTTNEELQSANEQLTSSNEELQSTNEELHSVNEELYTVNAEHQRKIDELTELNDDMDNLLISTNVHTIFLDRELCIRRFTPGIAETFSLIPQDVGRRFDSFSHQILYSGLIDEIRSVLKNGKAFEKEVVDQAGTWHLLRIQPYIARKRIDGVVITLIDITTLKNAEAMLREMSEIVEHSDDAIYRVDLDGTIRTWNLGASRLYGYESQQVTGKHVSILAPSDRPSEPESYLERIRTGIAVDRVETSRVRRNGTSIDVSLTVSPIHDHHRNIVGASVIARDITKQRQAEFEIREAVRHRDQFLATLSHELRNPLSAILNATSLLKEDGINADTIREAREVVDHQLRHVARLLDDLLEVARFTHGKIVLRNEVFDLTDLVMDVVDCIQFQVDEKKQQLRVDVSDGPLYVEGDLGRLQQAQVNLLVNASKYSAESRSISYGVGRDGNDAVITVRDEGQGIPASLLPSIFEPFTQADQSIERSQGGMGLGLPLVRMIAKAHNGTAVAHSGGPGRGSEFTIRIPITDKRPTDQVPSDTAATPGRKLLLIEDNDGIRRMLSRSMQLKGFEVATAVTGREGIEAIKEFRPDIAVVDIGLPDIDGYELARRVRDDPEHAGLILFAVTGYGREEDRNKADQAGFDRHLVKPIDPDELMRSIADFDASQNTAEPSAN
ncbi:Autoinducer 2 sensor kinase/phosphatase LuxQ [Stieleria maiorica]|uniref:histidine kinase n=1 Tax=Stieleria maiorica TaxID=2795974 RepID=A0A5B9M5E7_9BACT|nr:chemotaxis protein CheB [Stieleria maiorica]QEF96242.1 Autoinducer 2 sensor kinase/phosphatase LuxQ [Stieleria maiorica]